MCKLWVHWQDARHRSQLDGFFEFRPVLLVHVADFTPFAFSSIYRQHTLRYLSSDHPSKRGSGWLSFHSNWTRALDIEALASGKALTGFKTCIWFNSSQPTFIETIFAPSTHFRLIICSETFSPRRLICQCQRLLYTWSCDAAPSRMKHRPWSIPTNPILLRARLDLKLSRTRVCDGIGAYKTQADMCLSHERAGNNEHLRSGFRGGLWINFPQQKLNETIFASSTHSRLIISSKTFTPRCLICQRDRLS